MFDTIWEDLQEKHNEILCTIAQYNQNITNGNYYEYPNLLDLTVYQNLLTAQIINTLVDDESLYIPNHIISSLCLNNSSVFDLVEWKNFNQNCVVIKTNNFNKDMIIDRLFECSFDEKCKNFIQEICAQDISNSRSLAKDISSILNYIFLAISISVKGEDVFLRHLNELRNNGERKITKIESAFNKEYSCRSTLIYNRIFKHRCSNIEHTKPTVSLNDCDEALDYRYYNIYCQTAVLHIGVEKTGSSGTGFLISKDGYALTCAHVVEGASEICTNVIVGDGYPTKGFEDFGVYDVGFGKVVYVNKELDIALLKTEYCGSKFLPIEQQMLLPELGEEIVVFGYPLGYEMPQTNRFGPNISFYKGYVSSNQVQNGNSITFLDIDVKSGNSGSPVISTKTGKVIGIISGAKVGGNMVLKEKMPYMIPIQHFLKLIK